MTEQERIDRINQLRQRLAEANNYANHHYDVYMRALANVSRIRERIEDLLVESHADNPGWAGHHAVKKEMEQ
jgi:hypothetical protein